MEESDRKQYTECNHRFIETALAVSYKRECQSLLVGVRSDKASPIYLVKFHIRIDTPCENRACRTLCKKAIFTDELPIASKADGSAICSGFDVMEDITFHGKLRISATCRTICFLNANPLRRHR